MKKVLGWVVIAVIVLWVLNAPDKAAAFIDKVANALVTLGSSLG